MCALWRWQYSKIFSRATNYFRWCWLQAPRKRGGAIYTSETSEFLLDRQIKCFVPQLSGNFPRIHTPRGKRGEKNLFASDAGDETDWVVYSCVVLKSSLEIWKWERTRRSEFIRETANIWGKYLSRISWRNLYLQQIVRPVNAADFAETVWTSRTFQYCIELSVTSINKQRRKVRCKIILKLNFLNRRLPEYCQIIYVSLIDCFDKL